MSIDPDCKYCGGTGLTGSWPNEAGCLECHTQSRSRSAEGQADADGFAGEAQYDGTCEDRRLRAAGYVVCGSGADTQWHWMDPSGVWHDADARGRFYRQEHVAVRDALGHLAGERPTEPEGAEDRIAKPQPLAKADEVEAPFSADDAADELRRRYPTAFDGTDPLDRHSGLKLKNARDWVLAVAILADHARLKAREAALMEGLRKARWYVNDHQEAQPNDEARDDLALIDAVLS